ncbi:MAG TPA: DNA mismatch repair endonuclease MutL [Dehalococcoidia bacterium]|jgi:DNA mismatch repair protein MutL|nr:DNA mismatch repair endonuclease MutL [Dehalococcoidia bacterium]
MPIQVLSDDLASRIAAGEVIERPASVVKELVENSLDAGSTRIDVHIVGGGAQSITVVDNGQGIPAGELSVAFERFATSKIDESSDLIAIGTLGFRGEALPSIASVARVEAISRHFEADAGARYLVDFGKSSPVEAAGAPQGTRIEVAGLFKNVPARLKFLGSPGRELSRIQSMLASLALVHPDVAVSLSADGRERLRTIGSGKLVDAVSGVYGPKVAEQMLELEPDDSAAFSVDGLVSSPSLNRSNRTYMTISVNGRWIQSRRLSYAIEQAYHGFLPDRRFPIAIARIRTPLDDVDANVHPAKAEVRFLREDLVYSVVQRAVRGVLSASAPVHELGAGRAAGSIGLLRTPGSVGNNTPGVVGIQSSPASDSDGSGAGSGFTQWPDPSAIVEQSRLPESQGESPATSSTTGTPKETLPVLRVIGQSHETYIHAEGPDGVYLIDQHAAHERVMFERVQQKFEQNASESQPLLEAATVDLGPGVMTTVQEHLEELNRVGWGVEEFGTNSLIVRSVPASLATRASGDGAGQVFARVLDELSEGGTGETWRNRMLATIACHSSIRAGQILSIDECKDLIRQLERTERPNTCPHGRPTIVQLNVNDLEREFKRR